MKIVKLLVLAMFLIQASPAFAVCNGEMACYGWLRDGSGLCGLFTVQEGLQKNFIKLETTQMCTLKTNNCMYCQPESREQPAPAAALTPIPGKTNILKCAKNGNHYEIYDEFKNNEWCINTFDGRTSESIDVICPAGSSQREAFQYAEQHCLGNR